MKEEANLVLPASRGWQALPLGSDVMEQEHLTVEDRGVAASGKILACVDGSTQSRKVIAHARAIGQSLNSSLTLAQVLEPARTDEGPQDPLDWSARRHRCGEQLKWLAEQHGMETTPMQDVLLEGKAADELVNWTAVNHASIVALATHGNNWPNHNGLGSTAQKLLDLAPASILLVPPTSMESPAYRRILVPLDGSRRAESVLPIALAVARRHGSEILLTHIVPSPELTLIGPPEPEALDLQQRLTHRNEQVARRYLQRMYTRVAHCKVAARTILKRGDPRVLLSALVDDEAVDLVIATAQGHGGRADVSYGSVAGHLAHHVRVPMLIVRGTADLQKSAMNWPAGGQRTYLQ